MESIQALPTQYPSMAQRIFRVIGCEERNSVLSLHTSCKGCSNSERRNKLWDRRGRIGCVRIGCQDCGKCATRVNHYFSDVLGSQSHLEEQRSWDRGVQASITHISKVTDRDSSRIYHVSYRLMKAYERNRQTREKKYEHAPTAPQEREFLEGNISKMNKRVELG